MPDIAPPSIDYADLGTLGGTMRTILRKWLQSQLDDCMPCKVIAVTTDRNFVTVEPTVQLVDTLDNLTTRAQIQNVPVFAAGAGNFVMSWPIAPGDFGWIKASDRDISLYVQSGKTAAPNTYRLHKFADGVFYPDKARQWTLASEDAARAVWQSLDGTAKLALGTDELKIVHPTLVEIHSPHVTLTQGDLKVLQGLGVWNHAPPGSQPSITGALSAVSDTNAKAVLTSIIAVLVGCGLATNGTT